MSEHRKIKVIKKADINPPRDPDRSEVSLLEILIERNPERARELVRKIVLAKQREMLY